MKALEILKNAKSFGSTGREIIINKYKLEEAIKELEKIVKENIQDRLAELEALQNENKSLVKTLEKMNEEMIDLRKENQDLKNSNNELLKGLKSTQKRLEEWLKNASSNREKR